MPKPQVIVDTREKNPIKFANASVEKLETGDYTLVGYENILAIERKSTIGEFARNINEARFWKEMERMREIPHRHLVLNFTFDDVARFPRGSGIPKRIWKFIRVKPKYLFSCLRKIETEYGVTVHFCTGRRHMKETIQSIFDGVLGECT